MKYTLMHKTLAVASIEIVEEVSAITRIHDIMEPWHYPVGVEPGLGGAALGKLNDWWKGRAIPASRSGLWEALENMNISSPGELLLKCYGLSLSDQYWVKPDHKPLQWEDINFFQNDFSADVGNILFGLPAGKDGINLSSPDNTSDGWLRKKWVIAAGKRVLVKGGSQPDFQEPYNEALASSIMERLGIPHAPYRVMYDENIKDAQGRRLPLSACEDFITPDTELVSAWNIYRTEKHPEGNLPVGRRRIPNHLSLYEFFIPLG
jgi:hypothetical protein